MKVFTVACALMVAGLLLAGCSPGPLTPVEPEPTPSPAAEAPISSPTPSPAPTPSPSLTPAPTDGPEPETPAVPAGATCDSLLDDATRAKFDALAGDGWRESKDFTERASGDPVLSRFTALGGVACQWGLEGTDSIYDYGYSPIGARDANEVQTELAARGYVATAEFDGELFCNAEITEYEYCFLFTDGAWFHAIARSEFPMLIARAG